MKKCIHMILLIALFLPLTGMARDETLEERKQRIMRKYLRERTTTVQSDVMVPIDEAPEEDEFTASKRFSEAEVNIQRENSSTLPPPQIRQRPVPRKVEDSNWLLAEEEQVNDPFADPYATKPAIKTELFQPWEEQLKDSRKSSRIQQAEFREEDRREISIVGNRDNRSSTLIQPESRLQPRSSLNLFNTENKSATTPRSPSFTSPFNRQTPSSGSGASSSRQSRDRTFGNQANSFGSEGRSFGSDGRTQPGLGTRIPYRPTIQGNGSSMNESGFVRPTPKVQRSKKMDNSPFK